MTTNITYKRLHLRPDQLNDYVNAYTVFAGDVPVGATYQRVSGGWTGANELVESASGNFTAYECSVWETRMGAAYSLIQSTQEEL